MITGKILLGKYRVSYKSEVSWRSTGGKPDDYRIVVIPVEVTRYFYALFSKKLSPRKKEPHIRIPAGFTVHRWDKLGGEKRLDLMGLGGL